MTEYVVGAELPSLPITWKDGNGAIRPFASGFTFTVKIGTSAGTEITKTSGIVGADTAPNVTITWAAGEFDALAGGARTLQIFARETATSKDLAMQIPISFRTALA